MDISDDIFSVLHKMWRERVSRTSLLITSSVRYSNEIMNGELDNDHWAYHVPYAFREALDLSFDQRIKTVDKKSVPYWLWTQGPIINFKEGDLLKARNGDNDLQVVSSNRMGWDPAIKEMYQGFVTYRRSSDLETLHTITQMEFLAVMVFGESILNDEDRLTDITLGKDRFYRKQLLNNNKNEEEYPEITFIYRNAKGEVAAHSIESLTDSDNHIQAICLNSNRLKTFRKDRILEWLPDNDDVDDRLAYFIANLPPVIEKKTSDRVFKPSYLPDVCFTGFKKAEKEELMTLAKEKELVIRSSVTKELDILCCGFNAGPKKIEEARKKDTLILNKNEFINLVETGEISAA